MAEIPTPLWHEMSILDTCVRIEEICATIYYAFAGMFADMPDVAPSWTEMAIEEENHAEQFRMARAIHGSKVVRFDGENFLIKAMLEQITALSGQVRSEVKTLKDALLIALILERSVEKYHVETSMHVVDPELAKLLNVMVEYSHGHLEMLQRAVDAVGA